MIDAPSSTWFTVAPAWGWLIVFYFFFGGLAAGCYFLAALLDFFGRPEDRPLARRGYYVAVPCLMICGVLLTLDLSRPERFWHLFLENHTGYPMFKYWSPMSLGSWALPAFGLFAFLSFLGALAETKRLRWPGALRFRAPGTAGNVVSLVGSLLGLYVAGYTGVLLSVTNRPIWSDSPLLGMLLTVSAMSISAALMVLLARGPRAPTRTVFALHRMDAWIIALEVLVLIAVVVSLGPAACGWLNAWGLLLLGGAVMIGMAAPLALHRRRDWLGENNMVAAATLVLVGGLVLRTVIVFSSEAIHL